MSNVKTTHQSSTRLSERDRKVLNEYVNNYLENSALSQKNENSDSNLQEGTSSMNKSNQSDRILK